MAAPVDAIGAGVGRDPTRGVNEVDLAIADHRHALNYIGHHIRAGPRPPRCGLAASNTQMGETKGLGPPPRHLPPRQVRDDRGRRRRSGWRNGDARIPRFGSRASDGNRSSSLLNDRWRKACIRRGVAAAFKHAVGRERGGGGGGRPSRAGHFDVWPRLWRKNSCNTLAERWFGHQGGRAGAARVE